MTRRCSHCSNNGHNSRTCPSRGGAPGGGLPGGATSPVSGGSGGGGGGVRLFGVRLTTDGSIRKSASMGNLSSAAAHFSSSAVSPGFPGSPSDPVRDHQSTVAGGYVSDDAAHGSGSSGRERKKGSNRFVELNDYAHVNHESCFWTSNFCYFPFSPILWHGLRRSYFYKNKGIPWTEEEHKMFLVGLKKLGKGDWRGIARNYVVSRTPTQVASHAQKYFIRQTNSTRRKRRSSLFDMVAEVPAESQSLMEEEILHHPQSDEPKGLNPPLPPSNLSLDQDPEPMEAVESNEPPPYPKFPPMIPAFYPAYIPIPVPIWPFLQESKQETHVIKPTPVLKEAVNVDDIVGMSNKLSLGAPPDLTLKLRSSPSRPSAFHASQGPDHPIKVPDLGRTATT
ncbi:hypothetical protein QJS10_CPA06g00826 [Acorus calamus]|uniref:Uncharacterized protein n=1 Tax=Acorus calamus TaxID=4465 RepID=A0AAV9ELL1_ACOCL|nr:hypothetical protein QJS10_CPA06g00826 [Acorus calamus]